MSKPYTRLNNDAAVLLVNHQTGLLCSRPGAEGHMPRSGFDTHFVN